MGGTEVRTSIIDGCGRERERRGAILLVCFCLQLILSVVFHSPHAIQRLGLWNALKELKHEAQGKHTMHVACTTHVHRSLTAPSRALYVPFVPHATSFCLRAPSPVAVVASSLPHDAPLLLVYAGARVNTKHAHLFIPKTSQYDPHICPPTDTSPSPCSQR